MSEYQLKKEELEQIAYNEANKIVNELITKNAGKTTKTLRISTLDYIQQHHLPEDISYEVKKIIDSFISNLEIPTHINE